MKRLSLVILCTYLVFSGLLRPSAAWTEESEDNEKIIAQAGQQVLTLKAFNRKVNTLSPEYQTMIKHNPQLIQSLIDHWVQISLLSQEARAYGLDRDQTVAEKIDEAVNTILAQELVNRYVLDKIEVTDKEINDYYHKHRSKFEDSEMIRARHILIKVPIEATPDDWIVAEKRAYEIKKILNEGEDFSAVARAFSEDSSTKYRGGDLGFFPRGQMAPELEKVAFALDIGEVSDPIKTIFGYHIIKVEEKKAVRARPLEEVKEKIKNKLIEKKQEEIITKLLLHLENKYGVTTNPYP